MNFAVYDQRQAEGVAEGTKGFRFRWMSSREFTPFSQEEDEIRWVEQQAYASGVKDINGDVLLGTLLREIIRDQASCSFPWCRTVTTAWAVRDGLVLRR